MLLRDIIVSRKHLSKTAIRCGSADISYGELHRYALRCGAAINQYTHAGRNIGIFLPNSIQYVIAYFAITFAGKTIVPIHSQSKETELESVIKYCELGLIISNSHYMERLKTYLEGMKCTVSILNIDTVDFESIGEAAVGEDTLLHRQESCIEDENATALLLHTSGTTSNPKRVMLSHKNLIENAKSIIESLELTEEDKTLISLPLCMASANTSQLLTHLYLGASIVIMNSVFLPSLFFKLVDVEKITNFTGVPSLMYTIVDFKNRNNYDISSLQLICFGGAKTPVEKIRKLLEGFPEIEFAHMYGQTEASTRITHLLPQDAFTRIGSVGKPIPGVQVRIVDEEGRDVSVGTEGEVIVKGDNVMSGYYNRPEETAKVLRQGWLHTGDLGFHDAEGYIYIVGRKRNVIISGGMNIYPEELEEILMTHEYVREVCVMGEENEEFGQVPVAKVVTEAGAGWIGQDELINFCAKKIAAYKVPHRIYFVKELPKTVTGKVKR